MATDINQKYLQEHFRKHESITLYKPDGTPVTFRKQYKYEVGDGICKYTFKDFDRLSAFFQKHGISMGPVITVT